MLHQAILALNAQANIDPQLAKRVLELSSGEEIREVLHRRAQDLSTSAERATPPSDVVTGETAERKDITNLAEEEISGEAGD